MRVLLRLVCVSLLLAAAPVQAQAPDRQGARTNQPAAASAAHPLPPDAVTSHALDLPGRTLRFTAKAGFVRLQGGDGAPEADIGVTAYLLDGAEVGARPVTFVLNGGPGMASAWLQMGAAGPWRIDMAALGPSARPAVQPNAETWLDFTDLVFVDPVGTGFSTFATSSDDVRKRLWSVGGDIDGLAQAMRLWLDKEGRFASPKFLLGESYGGFRAPLLARRLAEHEGVGLRGLVMVSPVLDFGNRSGAMDVLTHAVRLPSMAAIARADRGEPANRADLADVEAYASGAFLSDALRGVADKVALDRVVERVSALTGLDPALVRQRRGLIGFQLFAREHASGRAASVYDATGTLPDPFPEAPNRGIEDPIVDGLRAPVTEAVLQVYAMLKWRPEGLTYHLASDEAARRWDWGRDRSGNEALNPLRQALALDPNLHAIVAHGVFDLVTPYYATRLLLNQIPPASGGDRVQLLALPGGHMFYSRDDARRDFRAEAARLIREGGS